MNKEQEILSRITVFSKYAKYLPEQKTRETWDQICDRYQNMMIDKYPSISDEIINNMIEVRNKKVLPSMRALQFAGEPIKKNHARIYNCAYLPVDDYRAFSETMFLLLGGTGVGYSVQFHHVEKLPAIKKPTKKRKFLIGDSIEGWADSVRAIMKAYFGLTSSMPIFDYSDIRPKGARLVTAGGKAPGPEPLKECLFQVQKILDRKEDGDKLTQLECHDIQCHLANAVLAGGIRRAAMISLFSFEDEEMLTCKYGNWWELNEQRGRSNNSVVLERDKITEDQFKDLWKKVELSGSGEPGIYWTNDKDLGTNPCCEISLRPFQFCNLSEINASNIESQEDLDARVRVAAFFGTLQAGFTDFHYLRSIWRETTEKDALIGAGMTGIGSGEVLQYDLRRSAVSACLENALIAEEIGINPAARVTTVKPSGTSSLVLGTSSGIHAWHNDYYLRSIRLGKNESIYTYLAINHPELIEDDYFRPKAQAIVRVPQKAPEGAILRTETALDLLERVKLFNMEWVKPGHRSGNNTNNVSATISIDKGRNYISGYDEEREGIPYRKWWIFEQMGEPIGSDQYNQGKFSVINEWQMVGEWMWLNKDTFNGLSVLNYDGGSYVQAPFEDITKERYEQLIQNLHDVDLSKVVEMDDETDLKGEAACAGGACEIV